MSEDASSSEYSGLKIQRGGEEFTLEKSSTSFVVRRKRARDVGPLAAVAAAPDKFTGLALDQAGSPRDLQVYRVDAASLDGAMRELREHSPDVAWCGHVYHMPGDSSGQMIPIDAIDVELAPGADPESVNALLDKHGLELVPAPRSPSQGPCSRGSPPRSG